MKTEENRKRPMTGNWRPFRPAGMSDGAWKTILLLHRYPSDEMDEEERKHCLGPMLFGKGGARFGDYGRGWIQERADELVMEGLTPYAMDAREWRDEVADAIDFYNGMGFDEGEAEGIVKPDSDFFVSNMSFPADDDADNIFAAMDTARSKMDDVWYRICYGPYGEGPWQVMTKGVLNGWKDVFACDEKEAFYRTDEFDWRCAAFYDDDGAFDVRLMAEICPVCPNAAIFGGIDCACDLLKEGGLETSFERKLLRYLKRAFGELHKRRNGAFKTGLTLDVLAFDRWLRKRECWAVDRFGELVRPDNENHDVKFVFPDVDDILKQTREENERLRKRLEELRKKRANRTQES